MQIFFKTRTAQRSFKGGAKKVDNGPKAGSRRWAVVLHTSGHIARTS